MATALLDEALKNGASYAEFFVYDLQVAEAALRGYSAELNQSKSKIYAIRTLCEGCWGVASGQRLSKWLVKEALSRALKARAYSDRRLRLASRKPAQGSFAFIGEEPICLAEAISKELIEVFKELRASHIDFSEIVVIASRLGKAMTSSDGVNAYELRDLIDLSISVAGRNLVSSACIGWSGGLMVGWRDLVERTVKSLVERLKAKQKAKLLNPLLRGSKFKVILADEAACAFIHEAVGHVLEADVLMEHGYGFKPTKLRGCEELTVCDDPSMPRGYGSYRFDDEGVEAKPKLLVDRGRVVGLLHTRWTAAEMGVEPMGNGRGVFFAPKSMPSNLVVSRGSWSVDEMVEETREGFYVEGLNKAEVYGGAVILYPDIAWYVKKGEVLEPVLLEEIRIPLRTALSVVDAVGKSGFTFRPSVEKGLPISECSPPLRLSMAYVR